MQKKKISAMMIAATMVLQIIFIGTLNTFTNGASTGELIASLTRIDATASETGDKLTDVSGIELTAWDNNTQTAIGGTGRTPIVINNSSLTATGWQSASAVGIDNATAFQIKFSTAGHEDVKFSCTQKSTGSGPDAFKLAYRVGGTGTFTEIADSQVKPVRIGNDAYDALERTYYKFALPKAVEDKAEVYLRVYFDGLPNLGKNGNTSINDIRLTTGDYDPYESSKTDRPDHLLINQVYGAGTGGTGAISNSFIELYNPTTAPVSLDGKSLQYYEGIDRGTPPVSREWKLLPLSGTIPAGTSFLVVSDTGISPAARYKITTADLTWDNLIISNRAYSIALVDGETALTGDDSDNTLTGDIIDLVGATNTASNGDNAYFYEHKAYNDISQNRSIRRVDFADFDENYRDFTKQDYRAESMSNAELNEVKPHSLADGAWGEDIRPTYRVSAGNTLKFSQPSGFYDNPFDLELSTEIKDGVIRYTTDGSEPTKDSLVYSSAIPIVNRTGAPTFPNLPKIDCTITVTGTGNPDVEMVLQEAGSPWQNISPPVTIGADGTFKIEHTMTYDEVEKVAVHDELGGLKIMPNYYSSSGTTPPYPTESYNITGLTITEAGNPTNVLYDMQNDAALDTLTQQHKYTNFLTNAGATMSVTGSGNAKVIEVTGRTFGNEGLEINNYQLLNLMGGPQRCTFSIKGKLTTVGTATNPGHPGAGKHVVIGESGAPWEEIARGEVKSDGTFSILHTMTTDEIADASDSIVIQPIADDTSEFDVTEIKLTRAGTSDVFYNMQNDGDLIQMEESKGYHQFLANNGGGVYKISGNWGSRSIQVRNRPGGWEGPTIKPQAIFRALSGDYYEFLAELAPGAPYGKDISRGNVVRAKVFDANGVSLTDKTYTHSYYIGLGNNYTNLPVISLTTDADNLFSKDKGIYSNPESKGSDWEKPVHFEITEPNGTSYSQDMGIRMHGNWSRRFSQKTFRLVAKSAYDPQRPTFKYDLFNGDAVDINGKPITEFNKFLLRQESGDSLNGAMMRDAILQARAHDMNMIHQAYRPAVVFINGEFWGYYNIREYTDEEFVQSNANIDSSKKIGMVDNRPYSWNLSDPQFDQDTVADYMSFNAMYDWFKTAGSYDFRDGSGAKMTDAQYQKAQTFLDIDNFIDYWVVEMIVSNNDWPGNNVDMWRYRTDYPTTTEITTLQDGRWRYILKDLDNTAGMFASGDLVKYIDSIFELLLEDTMTSTYFQSTEISTLLFRRLMSNDEFNQRFLTRMQDILNTNFKADVVTEKIDEQKEIMKPVMAEQIARWGTITGFYSAWEDRVVELKDFMKNRQTGLLNQISAYFGYGTKATLNINVNDTSLGHVKVNTIDIVDTTDGVTDPAAWSGIYLIGTKQTVTAVTAPTREHSRFEKIVINGVDYTQDSVSFTLTADTTVEVVFSEIDAADCTLHICNDCNRACPNLPHFCDDPMCNRTETCGAHACAVCDIECTLHVCELCDRDCENRPHVCDDPLCTRTETCGEHTCVICGIICELHVCELCDRDCDNLPHICNDPLCTRTETCGEHTCVICGITCELHICEECGRTCDIPDCVICNPHLGLQIKVVTVDEKQCIEISNPGQTAISAKGYYLMPADTGKPIQWQMPSVIIRPGDAVLFVSKTDQTTQTLKHCTVNFDIAAAKEVMILDYADNLINSWSKTP